jgi:ABC-2 type transport system permease protein
VQILIDASFATRAEIARGYAEAIVAQFNVERLHRLMERVPPGAVRLVGLDVVGRVWFNPTLETKYFMIPGLLVITLLFWAPILVSLSVTREKESGAILNVQAAPLARWEYVIGKLAPYVAVSFISYVLLLTAAVELFRVPVKGSVALLSAAAVLYIIALMGLGLLVSVLVRTQVAALLVTATIAMSIGIFYSGWLAPLSTLNAQGQAMGRLLPVADFMTLTRGVFLKGLGFSAYRETVLGLILYAFSDSRVSEAAKVSG